MAGTDIVVHQKAEPELSPQQKIMQQHEVGPEHANAILDLTEGIRSLLSNPNIQRGQLVGLLRGEDILAKMANLGTSPGKKLAMAPVYGALDTAEFGSRQQKITNAVIQSVARELANKMD